MLDQRLLKGMMTRKGYNALVSKIPREGVASSTLALIKWIGAYYKTHSDANEISVSGLRVYIKARNEARLEEDGVKLLLKIVDRLDGAVDTALPTILNTLAEVSLSGKLGKLVTDYNNGAEVDIVEQVTQLGREYAQILGTRSYESHDIYDILDEVLDERGIQIDIPFFRDFIKPMTEGISIALAGRPDTGKTSLLAYIVTRSIKSIVKLYGEERPVLWLINEGSEKAIIPRIYQAALGVPTSEIIRMRKDGTLKAKYEEAIGAGADMIQVIPIHGWDIGDVESLVAEKKPALVITDMVEHIGMHQDSQALKIQYLWQKLRELALIYKYVSIGTVQISESGSDEFYPSYDHLAYSKTALQASTDIIMMQGARQNNFDEDTRGWSLPKNKLKVEGRVSNPNVKVHFDKDSCVFHETEVEYGQFEPPKPEPKPTTKPTVKKEVNRGKQEKKVEAIEDQDDTPPWVEDVPSEEEVKV